MNKRTRIIVCAALLALAVCLTALEPVLTASAANSAPVAENMELCTYRNVSVGGRLTAVDPDGDEMSFAVTTQPVKGTVEVTEDGRFVYTPDVNRKGRDYFGYKATDSEGNVSQEATVIIRIAKQKTSVTYSDMTGSASAFAATELAETGVFTGSRIGSIWVFEPERQVTRGEFLSMCMVMYGEDVLSGVVSTGFYDDEAIPAWEKSFVATALMDGTVSGYDTSDGPVFNANAPVTRSEAAVLLDNLLELTEVSSLRWDEAAPAWAAQSDANLAACGIIADGAAYDAALTRADAAEMLVSAMAVRNAG